MPGAVSRYGGPRRWSRVLSERFAQVGRAPPQLGVAALDLHRRQPVPQRRRWPQRPCLVQLFESRQRLLDDGFIGMPEQAIQEPRVGRHLVRLQILARRGVERLGVLDREQPLPFLVALFATLGGLPLEVVGQRSAAREEPLQARLVLGVPGAALERLPLALIAARRAAAPIAHLADLTPAFFLPRAVVVGHRRSTRKN